MALGNCRECGGKVSSEAVACPHCGAAAPFAPSEASGSGGVFARAAAQVESRTTPAARGRGALFGAGAVLLLLGLGYGWLSWSSDAEARRRAEELVRQTEERERARKAEVAREDQQQAVAARAAQEAATKRAASLADLKKRLATMKAEDRARELKSCVDLGSCPAEDVAAIFDSASSEGERTKLKRLAGGVEAAKSARSGEDGQSMSATAIAQTVMALEKSGTRETLLEMPQTTIGAAAKDPAGARGKVIVASGSVVEIRKSAEFFEGAIATDSMSFVRFVTKLPTNGIERGTRATFRGVFVQEYAYSNVSGGQTRSLLVVGAFDSQ